jgi:hypothetical protein
MGLDPDRALTFFTVDLDRIDVSTTQVPDRGVIDNEIRF